MSGQHVGSPSSGAGGGGGGAGGAERSVVLATAGFDHTIRFWEAPTGLCHRTLSFADSQVNRLCITPDKSLLAAAGNPLVRLYEIHSSANAPVASFEGHSGNVTAVGFQKDRKWMYTGSEDGSVKVWDVRAPGFQRDYQCKSPVTSVALHPNQGELLAADEDGHVRVWDLAASACSYELVPDGKTPVRSVCVASDASLVAAATNRGSVFLWRLARPGQASAGGSSLFEPLHKIDAHGTYCLTALLSPDVKYLATTSADKTVKLWNADNGFKLERTLAGHTAWVYDASFSADSAYLVTASSDRTAKLWDLKTGEVILDYKGHHKAVTAVALNDAS